MGWLRGGLRQARMLCWSPGPMSPGMAPSGKVPLRDLEACDGLLAGGDVTQCRGRAGRDQERRGDAPGISEENIEKLFQPLFTTKSMGQGFGLSLCRRIVEGYDREMQVESEVGRGNKFPAP